MLPQFTTLSLVVSPATAPFARISALIACAAAPVAVALAPFSNATMALARAAAPLTAAVRALPTRLTVYCKEQAE